MPHDELLRLTGSATGNPVEASITTTAEAVASAGYKYVGKYRSGYLEIRIAGHLDRTSGDEGIVVGVKEATDAAGSGAAIIASTAALTTSNAGNLGTTTTGTTPGSFVAAGSLSTAPTRLGFQTGSGGYVAAYWDAAGTSPRIDSLSVEIVMDSNAFRQSGT